MPRGLNSAWISPWVLACVVLAALVYGSLIPFDFSAEHPIAMPGLVPVANGSSSIGVPYVVSDLVTNVLLYVPLGLTLRLALRRRAWGVLRELMGSVGICFFVSLVIETLQTAMPARVGSLNDVAMNTAGGLIGGLSAVCVWQLIKQVSFAMYCRVDGMHGRLSGKLTRPGIAITIALINALVIGVWYVREVQRGMAGGGEAVLPFERAFGLPYDLGALLLGEALLVYAGLGCLLLLLTYTGTRRLAMNWVVLAVVGLAFAAELTRAVTQGAAPDVTGVLLALAAASIMTVTVYAFTHAVRRMNRRQSDEPYDGPERRRKTTT